MTRNSLVQRDQKLHRVALSQSLLVMTIRVVSLLSDESLYYRFLTSDFWIFNLISSYL